MAPSKKPGWIDWRDSRSRALMIADFEGRVIPEGLCPNEAWVLLYKDTDEFIEEKVVYSQFEERYLDYAKKIGDQHRQSSKEHQMLLKHRRLHPRPTHNERGERIWDNHEAKKKLREDVKEKKHETMAPRQLKGTRPEYSEFSDKQFREHVYQEVRRQKFDAHLEWKREKAESDKAERREKKARKAKKAKEAAHAAQAACLVPESLAQPMKSDKDEVEDMSLSSDNMCL